MRIKREFVLRSIAGEKLLVPVGKTAIEMNGLAVTNDVGARIWELLPEAPDEAAVVQTLIQEYEAPAQDIARDTAEFLQQLRELDIIE